MIRNEAEYQEALSRLKEERQRLDEHRAHLSGMGLDDEELKRALDPLRSFHLQLEEEVQSYERLKRGDIGELLNLHGLGQALIALRIARGLTQRELTARLDVHEPQVSRDERGRRDTWRCSAPCSSMSAPAEYRPPIWNGGGESRASRGPKRAGATPCCDYWPGRPSFASSAVSTTTSSSTAIRTGTESKG